MTLENQDFYPTRLEEDRTLIDQVNSRLNKKERQWLDALKLLHNTDKDSTALKKEAFKSFILQEKLAKVMGKSK